MAEEVNYSCSNAGIERGIIDNAILKLHSAYLKIKQINSYVESAKTGDALQK